MLTLLISLICAYLIGSVPFGYLYGRIFKGIDIREYGSGNIGATNILRTLGKAPAILVLFLDALKGFVCVALIPVFAANAQLPVSVPLFKVLLAITAILGHNWTIFLKFKGGKGVATGAGVIIGLMPKVILPAFLVWLIVVIISKYVSLASITASIFVPIYAVLELYPIEFIIFSSIACVLSIIRHRQNIKSLLNGTEKKISKGPPLTK